jgi:hypothetical protein
LDISKFWDIAIVLIADTFNGPMRKKLEKPKDVNQRNDFEKSKRKPTPVQLLFKPRSDMANSTAIPC